VQSFVNITEKEDFRFFSSFFHSSPCGIVSKQVWHCGVIGRRRRPEDGKKIRTGEMDGTTNSCGGRVAPCWNVSWKSDETTLELEHVLRVRERDADREMRERET
jgi:hypothetical protein